MTWETCAVLVPSPFVCLLYGANFAPDYASGCAQHFHDFDLLTMPRMPSLPFNIISKSLSERVRPTLHARICLAQQYTKHPDSINVPVARLGGFGRCKRGSSPMSSSSRTSYRGCRTSGISVILLQVQGIRAQGKSTRHSSRVVVVVLM